MVSGRWFALCVILLCLSRGGAASGRYSLRKYANHVAGIVNYHMYDKEKYATLNAFIDKKVKYEWSNLILSTYAKKIPVVLFESDDCRAKLRLNNVKFHRLIAIYEHLSDVNILQWRSRTPQHWNPRAEFVIWITGGILRGKAASGGRIPRSLEIGHTTNVTTRAAKRVFEKFWLCDIVNVSIVFFNATMNDFNVLYYNPFLPVAHGKRGKVFRMRNGESIFPDKLTNLYGQPIRITMFQKLPYVNLTKNGTEMGNGEDVDLFRMLQAKMNFSIQLVTHGCSAESYGTKLRDGTSVGLIGDLLVNQSEVLGNSRYIDVVFDRKLETLYPIDSGAYYALVPMSPEVSVLGRISHHWFSLNSLVGISPVLLLTLYLYLRKEPHPILATWNLVLNQRFARIGRQSSDRVMRLTFVVFAMLIMLGFEGRLFETLTSHHHKSEINTLRDLDESGLTLMVGDKMLEPINKSTMPVMRRISLKTRTNLNFSRCTDALLKRGDVACAIDEMSALLALVRLWKAEGKYRPHLMQEELGIFWMSYVVRQDLPYVEKFNAILGRLLETGFKARETKHSRDYVKTIFIKDLLRQNRVTINIRHLRAIFLTCLAGIGVSFLVFLVEIYVEKKRRSVV